MNVKDVIRDLADHMCTFNGSQQATASSDRGHDRRYERACTGVYRSVDRVSHRAYHPCNSIYGIRPLLALGKRAYRLYAIGGGRLLGYFWWGYRAAPDGEVVAFRGWGRCGVGVGGLLGC